MNWAKLVERLARALGVWERGDGPLKAGTLSLSRDGDGFRVFVSGVGIRRTITTGQALWLLLEAARGQRLDVGPCRACSERGGGWEWRLVEDEFGDALPAMFADGWTVSIHREAIHKYDLDTYACSRPCPECSEPGPEVACATEWCLAKTGNVNITCDDCEGKGRVPGPPQPTGRDTMEPWVWVLDAMPRDKSGIAGMTGLSKAYLDSFDGDPAVRAAASVLAEHMQAKPGWVDRGYQSRRYENEAKARQDARAYVTMMRQLDQEHGKLSPRRRVEPIEVDGKWRINEWRVDTDRAQHGLVIAAGLRGECQGCEGGTQTRSETIESAPHAANAKFSRNGWDIVSRRNGDAVTVTASRECPDCRGLGAVLGAPNIAVERLAVAECEARECPRPGCKGRSGHVDPHCSICGGTGRRSAA